MQKWMIVLLAGLFPAFFFLVLHDTVQGFYGPSRELPLSYSVLVEEDEIAIEDDAADEPASEDVAAVEEETPSEDVVAEDPAEDIVAEETPTDEEAATPAEQTAVAEDAPDADTQAATDTTEAVTEADTAPATEEAPVAAETSVALLSDAEMAAGEAAARSCIACHQMARERNGVGPHLVGVGGRSIGSVEGFRYSDALMALNAEGAIWDAASLEAWLENPDAFADGSKMMFNVRDPEDRRLIAGWLMQRDQ